jgi:hypothetical protein
VHQILPGPPRVWAFPRSEGGTLPAPADDVIFDDIEAALEAYLPRLGLGPDT